MVHYVLYCHVFGLVYSSLIPCGLVLSRMLLYVLAWSYMIFYESVCSHTNLFDLRSYAQYVLVLVVILCFVLQTKLSIVSREVWLKQARYLQDNVIRKQIRVRHK